MKRLAYAILFAAVSVMGQQQPAMDSLYAKHDAVLTTNPASSFWRTPAIYAESDKTGHLLSDYRTEIRSRWTDTNLYFLFICPYKELYLKPSADTHNETYELWNWNVAEVFIGSDFQNIKRYREFEVSPRNEWIDLDIDLNSPHHEDGWKWNSGFEHVTQIDQKKHVWYMALRIPLKALGSRPAEAGTMFRVNFFRTEGGPHDSKEITWQPVMGASFHVPERFGLLRLMK